MSVRAGVNEFQHGRRNSITHTYPPQTDAHTHTHTHTLNQLDHHTHIRRQHNTAKHRTADHSTAQHSTAQHSTAQHSTAQHSTAQHSTARRNSTAQHSGATACHNAHLAKQSHDERHRSHVLFVIERDVTDPKMEVSPIRACLE